MKETSFREVRRGSICRELMRRDFRGMTIAQIAETLGISPEQARSSMWYAKRRYGFAPDFARDDPARGVPAAGTRPRMYGQVVHGKCESCCWYSEYGPCCDFNYMHFPGGGKHGPIDEAEGGCAEYQYLRERRAVPFGIEEDAY